MGALSVLPTLNGATVMETAIRIFNVDVWNVILVVALYLYIWHNGTHSK